MRDLTDEEAEAVLASLKARLTSHRVAVLEPARHRAPGAPARLLMALFGPGVRPTDRGLSVARLALLLSFVLAVLVLALAVSGLAEFLVDPSPEFPTDTYEAVE